MNFGSDGILIFRSNISKHVGGGKKGERKNIDRSICLLYRILLFLVQRITWKMDGSFGDYYRRGQKEGGKNGRKIIKRLLSFRDNLFEIIFVYKYYTFFSTFV